MDEEYRSCPYCFKYLSSGEDGEWCETCRKLFYFCCKKNCEFVGAILPRDMDISRLTIETDPQKREFVYKKLKRLFTDSTPWEQWFVFINKDSSRDGFNTNEYASDVG